MDAFVEALEKLAAGLEAHSEEFTQLDSEAGDGDLGLTAGKIAGGIRLAIAEPGDSVKQLVLNLGKEISKAAPSTFGTLYASGFLAAGLAVSDDDEPLAQLQAGLNSALEKIAQRWQVLTKLRPSSSPRSRKIWISPRATRWRS